MNTGPPGGAKHREKGDKDMRTLFYYISFLWLLREPEIYDD